MGTGDLGASLQSHRASQPLLEVDHVQGPELPPGLQNKNETADSKESTPLFMKDAGLLDWEDDDAILDALRALEHEGTRAEAALNCRELGNKAAKANSWLYAKQCYTNGIAVLTASEDKWEQPADIETELLQLRETKEACYVNRALCNLKLENYRSATLDCASALKVNSKNTKAFYRSAMALLALGKLPEAEDAATCGLELEPNNRPLQEIASRIGGRKEAVEAITEKKRMEEERAYKIKLVLSNALQARQIRVRITDQSPNLEDARMHLTPDPLSIESTLVFPSVFLYPLDAQSDFIKAFSESDTIAHHLSYVFPLPWDSNHEYELSRVNCYMENATGGLIQAGKKLPLSQILKSGKVEVVDELIKIYIVPATSAEKWIEQMKSRQKRS
ncbi:hypothetical protein Egran_02051 [Elaphomyces granulatus]|uniref:Cns1/TTC4 wheel domain-containing protein n=1 Tax=Elaphomyces granulatus TaxID=519963 RepID=A0A232M1A8_9EURO|nr:hypothetical protein Egran_02051 [Elaphomyces granulatus]